MPVFETGAVPFEPPQHMLPAGLEPAPYALEERCPLHLDHGSKEAATGLEPVKQRFCRPRACQLAYAARTDTQTRTGIGSL